MLQRGARLFDAGSPAKIGLELGRARKVSDIVDTGDVRRGLHRANPGDRGQDLTLMALRHNPRHLRVQLRQVLLNAAKLPDELVLLKDEAPLTDGSFVPILCAANPWRSRSLASESERVMPRASCNADRLEMPRTAGIGKRVHKVSVVGKLGSWQIWMNSGKSSSQIAVS